MAGRKAIVYDNRAVMEFLWQYGELNQPLTLAVPEWVDNCVAGACRYGGNRASSPNAMLNALSQLPFISAEIAERFVNRKNSAMGDKLYAQAHCYSFFLRLRMASKAIVFHYETRTGQKLIFPHI